MLSEFSKGFDPMLLIPIGIVILFGFTLSIYFRTVGRRARKCFDGQIIFNIYDKLYTEFQIVILGGAIYALVLTLTNNAEMLMTKISNLIGYDITIPSYKYYNFNLIVLSFVCFYLIMCPIGSLTKHIKNKTFFKNTLLYNICLWIDKLVNHNTKYKTYRQKLGTRVITLFILAIIPVIGWIMILVLGMRWKNEVASDSEAIKEATRKIKNGDYDVTIDGLKSDVAIDTGMNLVEIKNNINNIVEEKVRDEKAKVEMILNASFDLKNPLESILENVEILEKDPALSTNNKRSIEIIRSRAERLKVLSNEINNGTSKGKLKQENLNLQTVDIFSLLAKGLSEIEKEMQKSNLKIKLNIKKSKIVVVADESLLWRAFENLIKDVFQYAQKGTNVFISIDEQNGCGIISIRNEIKDELKESLKISSEQFKQIYLSDNSKRSSLMVSKNLIEKQGGALDVKLVDGSFIASLILKLA